MTEGHDGKQPSLRVAATAQNAVEADVICQRLRAEGIVAVVQRSIGGPEWGLSGSQYVYVEAAELDRARRLLAAPDDVSDEELARQSEEAATQPTPREQAEPPAGADMDG